jgi:DNA polymerase III delta subunit
MHTAQAGLAFFFANFHVGLAMIVVILGPDAAICRTEANRVILDHDPAGENTSRFDGKTLRISEAVAMVGTPAFFGGGRVIVIDDLLARLSRNNDCSGTDAESELPKQSRAAVDLSTLFASVQPENLLVLADPSLASMPAAVNKQLPKNAEVILGEPPRGHALIKWMQDQAAENNGRIERDAAQLLAEMLFPQTWSTKPSNPRFDHPPDLDLLTNEIARLALFAHPDPIARHHVQVLADPANSDRLFSFVEQSVAGNLAKSVRDLESFDIHSDDAHRAANQLYQQIELSTVLASAQTADPATVGRDLGLSNPQRMFGVARAPRPASVLESVLDATDTDRRLKTGHLKSIDDAIYGLITDLSENKRQTSERRGRS